MPKDKQFPKRPPGPYALFMQDQQKKREGRSFGEWSRQMSEKWKNMAENQKQIWVERAAQVVREHPNVGPHQIMRILARMWVQLPLSDKGKYNKMALMDKKRYLSDRPKTPNTRNAPMQAAQASNPGPSKPARVGGGTWFFNLPFQRSSDSEPEVENTG